MSGCDHIPLCVVEALLILTPLTGIGKAAGIHRLRDIVAQVRLPGRQDERGIRMAPAERAGQSGVVESLEDVCTDSLAAYYPASEKKRPHGGKVRNDG